MVVISVFESNLLLAFPSAHFAVPKLLKEQAAEIFQKHFVSVARVSNTLTS